MKDRTLPPRGSYDHHSTGSTSSHSSLMNNRPQSSDSRFDNRYKEQDPRTTESFLQVFGSKSESWFGCEKDYNQGIFELTLFHSYQNQLKSIDT